MQELQTSNTETWHELQNGNISVTKSEIPFVSIAADHACEQVNRMMKIHSGLTGITNNANAWRFFLATPEISRLSTEFKKQFDVRAHKPQDHHEVQPSNSNSNYTFIALNLHQQPDSKAHHQTSITKVNIQGQNKGQHGRTD